MSVTSTSNPPAAQSTDWRILDAEGAVSFGTSARGPLDPRSHYAALSLSGSAPSGDGDGTTGTDRAFTSDVSNNSVLGSIDADGFIHGIAVSYGLEPVYETGLPGVLVNKDFDYVEGRLGLQIDAHESRATQSTTDFIDNLLPRVHTSHGLLDTTRVTFAPLAGATGKHPRGLVAVTRIRNVSALAQTVTVTAISEVTKSHGVAALSVIALEGFDSAEPAAVLTLEPNASHTFVIGIVLARSGAEEVADQLRGLDVSTELVSTLAALRNKYGRLTLGGDTYYAGFFERQAELARQVMLFDTDGVHAGSFWGSDANDRADVWMLDLYYSTLPLAQLDPALCRATIDFFVTYGLPPAAWGNYSAMDEGHPLPGIAPVSHSVGNVTGAIALAGSYLSATGDLKSLIEDSAFIDYGISIMKLLLDSRKDGDSLFPSVFISDGPSRGDFHTGSNIKAWYALTTMATILSAIPAHASLAARLSTEATAVREAIFERCAGTGSYGDEFFEGAWRDGTHVPGHDGEESDLTLASFYEFADIDETRIINHALSAFSTDNPYFRPATNGVSWWDFQFHGPTFPAYIHALSAASAETESLAALEAIRARTDLDGSVWWWPHLDDEMDSSRVLRGPGKCGWAAGVYVSKFIHDILGIRTDAMHDRLTLAPFSPWDSFDWTDGVLGKFHFDARFATTTSQVSARITNRGVDDIVARIELLVPAGHSITATLHDGSDAVEASRRGTRFSRSTVLVEKVLKAGESTELILQVAELRDGHTQVTGGPELRRH
jgi:hypothetical protein